MSSILAFALSRVLPLSLVVLGLSGLSATVFGMVLTTSLQLATAGHLRGYVLSLYAVTVMVWVPWAPCSRARWP